MGIINVLKLAAKPVTKFLQKNTNTDNENGTNILIFAFTVF